MIKATTTTNDKHQQQTRNTNNLKERNWKKWEKHRNPQKEKAKKKTNKNHKPKHMENTTSQKESQKQTEQASTDLPWTPWKPPSGNSAYPSSSPMGQDFKMKSNQTGNGTFPLVPTCSNIRYIASTANSCCIIACSMQNMGRKRKTLTLSLNLFAAHEMKSVAERMWRQTHPSNRLRGTTDWIKHLIICKTHSRKK